MLFRSIEEQLIYALEIIAGSLRAGNGLIPALRAAHNESREPLRSHLKFVLGQVMIGEDPLQAIQQLSVRVPLDTFRFFTVTMCVHWESGGTVADTLLGIAKAIRDRVELMRRVQAESVEVHASVVSITQIHAGSATNVIPDEAVMIGNVRTFSTGVLDLISRRVGVDVRRFYSFESLEIDSAEARFGAGWAFERFGASVRVPRMNSYGVVMEDGRARVELEPGRFYAPEAFARIGENFARGSYEHDLRTRDYRFLLEGRLRPLDIGGWFGPWWPAFFRQLEFPAEPPEASVEVAGRWKEGRLTRVFVSAESERPVVRGVPLDRVRTRLLIRPGFVDALDAFGARGDGQVAGTFTYRAVPGVDWSSLEFRAESTLELPVVAGLLGELGKIGRAHV